MICYFIRRFVQRSFLRMRIKRFCVEIKTRCYPTIIENIWYTTINIGTKLDNMNTINPPLHCTNNIYTLYRWQSKGRKQKQKEEMG